MRRVRWTPAQDNHLRALVALDLPWDAIAAVLNRAAGAVEHRALCLGARRPADMPGATPGATPVVVRRGGWPVMVGTPEERDLRFRCALLAEARACGLLDGDVDGGSAAPPAFIPPPFAQIRATPIASPTPLAHPNPVEPE